MRIRHVVRGAVFAQALMGSVLLAGCDGTSTGLELDDPTAAVVVGRVSLAGGGGAMSSAQDLSGIVVTINGSSATDVTDADGAFRVEGTAAADGRLELRFQKGEMDVTLGLQGVAPGTVVQITVSLSQSSATLDDSSSSDRVEFEGDGVFVSAAGVAPSRTLTLDVVRDNGTTRVALVEGSTVIESDGDLTTFDQVLTRVEAGLQARVEGDGAFDSTGQIVATSIKVETDDDDDDNDNDDDGDDDDEDFEGNVLALALTGDAPLRVARVTLDKDGRQQLADIVEGTTTFDPDGDVLTFDGLLGAFASGTAVKIEGNGDLQDGGAYLARTAKVETDGDSDDDSDDDNDNDDDFDGKVTSLSTSTAESGRIMRVQLVDDDDSYVVEIVEGVTQFDTDGDFKTFDQVLAAYDSGVALEMDGEGSRQEDGSILAREVEVEIDD